MDIRELRYVLAVYDAGTLTRAAERLHVSRQAVAKTLRGVEAEAGARLFERAGQALAPTDRCEQMVGEGREVVAAFDRLCARTLRHPGGAPASPGALREQLSVALVTGGSVALPQGLLERFSTAYPQVALGVEEMSADAVIGAVERGNAEVGIVGSHPALLGGLDCACVLRVGVWLYVPAGSRLARRGMLGLRDLDGLPMVTAGQHNHVHRFVMGRCAEAGVRPDIRAYATDTALLVHLLAENGASCFGFPPSLQATPDGYAAVPLGLPGGELFGTYLVRRQPGARGGAVPSRAAASFWRLATSGAAGAAAG